MRDVIVVGGGIAGLSLAYLLKKGEHPLDVLVLEKKASVGGKNRTEEVEGHLIEIGPNGFLSSKEEAIELVKDAGFTDNILYSSDAARKRFVLHNGTLHKLPEDPKEFLKSRLLSVAGKLRLLSEPIMSQKKGTDDETVAQFAIRRLGTEALDRLIDPMVTGVFAGDPYRLSLKSSFPKIFELESNYGGLFKGMVRLKKQKKLKGGPAGPAGVLTSFKKGQGWFLKELAKKVEVETERQVERVYFKKDRWVVYGDGFEYESRFVVLATPAYITHDLVKDFIGSDAEVFNEIPYAPCVVVAFSYDDPDRELKSKLNGFGFLIPSKEKRNILGSLWTSSIFPGFRSPEDKFLIRTILGGAKRPEMIEKSDNELIEITKDEIKDIVGIKQEPGLIKIYRHPKGIPQYNVGHSKKVEAIERISKENGSIFFVGNAYRGISLADCIKDAYRMKQRIIDAINSKKEH